MSIPRELSSLVKQVYSPPTRVVGNFSIEQWIGTNSIRYYSLGRHALVAALRILNVSAGDRIALPEFICRDLLASIASVGAEVHYYPVNEKLGMACAPGEMAGVKAIIAVNYFGFPQDMGPFDEVWRQTGAIIIEDNAHGFLSRDIDGVPLGRRAPLGIYSLRKTLPLVNGAALVANDKEMAARLPEQLSPVFQKMPMSLRLKQVLRRTVPVVGVGGCRTMTEATRMVRWLRTGHAIQPSQCDGETNIPLPAAPDGWSFDRISQLDEKEEIGRRRNLYSLLDEELRSCGAWPVFDEMPSGISPYVFPFRASNEMIPDIRKKLNQMGLECHRWPDLPVAVQSVAKSYYLNVWMVPFLW